MRVAALIAATLLLINSSYAGIPEGGYCCNYDDCDGNMDCVFK